MLQARQDHRADTRVPSTKQTLKRCCAGIRTIIGYSFILIASRWQSEINHNFSFLRIGRTVRRRHALLTVTGRETAGEKFPSHQGGGGFERAREKCVATTLLRRSPHHPLLALPLPSSPTSLVPFSLPLASSGTCYNSHILAPRSPLSLATQKLRALNLSSFTPFSPLFPNIVSTFHSLLFTVVFILLLPLLPPKFITSFYVATFS